MAQDPWFLNNLAPDVVLAGSVMNGSLRGAEAVRAQIRAVIGLYRNFTPVYEGELEDRRVSEYTAVVDGRPLTGVGTFHLNEKGQVDEIVVNHRPLSAALTVSRLLGEALAAEGECDEFYHPDGQSYSDLIGFAETHPARALTRRQSLISAFTRWRDPNAPPKPVQSLSPNCYQLPEVSKKRA
jgi:hypothetical protein